MLIVLHCGGIPFNGDTINHRSLGGSETAAYHLARELAKDGHTVRMFTNDQEEGTWDGVQYVWSGPVTERSPLGERFQIYATNTPSDVLILQRHPLALRERYAAKQCYLWMHDLALVRNKAAYDAGDWQMTGAFVVSEFHKAQVEKSLNVLPRVVLPITNGVDPARYEKATADVGYEIRAAARGWQPGVEEAKPLMEKIRGEFALLYSSRPERGMENLVRPDGIMAKLAEKAPGAHLYICNYEHDVPEMRQYYEGMFEQARRLPNVTVLGPQRQDQLASIQKSAQLHVYPTKFEEVSCITAMECMHAGLPMVVSRHAAIPETTKGAGVVLVDLKDGEVDVDLFVTHVSRLAKKGAESPEYAELVARQKKVAPKYTWESTAAQVLSYIEQAFSKAQSSRPAMIRHLLRYSDLQTARYYWDKHDLKDSKHPIVKRCGEEFSLYAFADDPTKYAEHYAKGCAEFYDGPEYRGPEDVSGSLRFMCVADWVRNLAAVRGSGSERRLVLVDVGCAHGHYTVGLAKRYPGIDFLGLDVSPRAVEEARKAAAAAGVSNCRFERVDGLDWQTPLNGARADIVLMGEVLEHVLDPWKWCTDVLGQIAADGAGIVFTTPIGPWEEISYQKQHPTRFHVQHFERADLFEMFGHFAGPSKTGRLELTVVANGILPNGDLLANHVGVFTWGVAGDPREVRPFDYERKLREQMPRETCTLGMIVKDGEATLRKTLDALVDVVDEIVIGIDSATKDDTAGTIDRLRAQRGVWPIITAKTIPPALETGFDAARNSTLEDACGDWFLWVDSDEHPVRANIIPRFLRPNCFNGYAIAQHHFAVEPAGILMTDLPSRLFRVSCGATFLGRVHEHPEIGDNQGVGAAMLMPGVHIAHHGYYTEEIRRARFQRNIALMYRDRKENPGRKLGKFLWIRDLSHMVTFTAEQTGGQVTREMQAWAQEAIGLFEDMLRDGELRLIRDALQYYSNAVRLLGGFVSASWQVDVQRGMEAQSQRAQPVSGVFANRKHVETLGQLILSEQLKQFDTKYW